MIQRHFKLALTAGRTIPLVIPANQYDSGEQWLFTLYDEHGDKFIPTTGAIVGIKSDSHAIINTGTVDSAGRVVITETTQMTAAVGKNIYELLIEDQMHGTANFIVMVEPRPGDDAEFSDSDLSLLEEAIQGTSQTAIIAGVQDWMDDNLTEPTEPIVDASLSLSGAAADAKKTGDEISALRSAIDGSVTELNLYNPNATYTQTNAVGDSRTGYTINSNIDSILYCIVSAFATTCLTFTAQNYGAKNKKRINKTLLYSIIQVTVVGFVCGVILILFIEPLSMLFMPENATNIDVILKVSRDLCLLLLSTYFLLGILSVISGALRGIGYSILQMILYIVGLCGTRVVWVYTAFPFWTSPVGLMMCYPVSWIVCIIFLGTARIVAEKKLKLIDTQKETV